MKTLLFLLPPPSSPFPPSLWIFTCTAHSDVEREGWSILNHPLLLLSLYIARIYCDARWMKRIKYLLGNLTMINFALFFFAALLFSFLTSEETVYPLLSEVRMFYEKFRLSFH